MSVNSTPFPGRKLESEGEEMGEEEDWTCKDGRANSSDEYLRLVAEVEQLIRRSAHSLIAGRAQDVAGLIMAQLAHVHGLRLSKKIRRFDGWM